MMKNLTKKIIPLILSSAIIYHAYNSFKKEPLLETKEMTSGIDNLIMHNRDNFNLFGHKTLNILDAKSIKIDWSKYKTKIVLGFGDGNDTIYNTFVELRKDSIGSSYTIKNDHDLDGNFENISTWDTSAQEFDYVLRKTRLYQQYLNSKIKFQHN